MKRDRRTGAGRRYDDERTAKRRCAIAQARQPVTVAGRARIESPTVVVQLEPQNGALDFKRDRDFAARRVLDDVVDGFLEDEEDLATDVGAQRDILIGGR